MNTQPKMLFIDIETSPLMGAVWKLWDNNLSLDMIEDEWFIMSYCAKWLGSDDIIYNDCRHELEDDYVLLKDIHELMNEADFIVAHNGDKFDIKKINARFMLNGFEPPSPYKTIDTLKMAKKSFAFTSNKLEYLTDKLCANKKLTHGKYPGYKLWKECLAGNMEAWNEMEEYNIMDVVSLEELYLILRPWHPNHPLIYTPESPEDYICPKCGGTHVQKRGKYVSKTGIKYQRYQCQECRGWSKGRYAEGTREQKELMPTPL